MKTWYRYDGIRNSPVINGDQVSYSSTIFLSDISNSDFYNLRIPENRFQELLSAWLSNEKSNL